MQQVQHDESAHRFSISLPGGTALLAYAPAGEGVLEFFSTYVPPAERGRGVAGRLVTAGLDHARSRGLRVIPSCWYVQVYLTAHPEYGDLVAA